MSKKEDGEDGESTIVELTNGKDNTTKKKTLALLSNGHNKMTDFPNSSAAQLLKTIVIASQSANLQQQQSSTKSTMGTVEKPLPRDLQSFKGDPFTLYSGNLNNGGLQTSMDHQETNYVLQGMESRNSDFQNGMNSQLLQVKESKPLTEALQINIDQNGIMQPGNMKQNGQLQTFEGLKGHDQQSAEFNISKSGVLQRLLSSDNLVVGPPRNLGMSSPTISPPNSAVTSPYGTDSNLCPYSENTQSSTLMDTEPQNKSFKELNVSFLDTTTQSSLITHTGNLRLDSMAVENNMDGDVKYNLGCEWNVTKLEENLACGKSGKVRRLNKDSDASSALSPSVDNVFRAETAQQEVPSDFTFQLFGQGEGEVFPILSENDPLPSLESAVLPAEVNQTFKIPNSMVKQQRERLRRSKEPILSQAFPTKLHGYELRILQQPEEQHRARYLTEGSRGAVKNRSGTGFPQVKLLGYTGEATLQVFIGNDSGRVRPHGFYQACKVCGKNSTVCNEKDVDGTTVIEIELQAANDMTASIDCVGILKLRNADVEQRIGIAKAKKKSTKARMIFRVTFQKPNGSPQVLQVASSTILCTQPIGQPEICKMSLKDSLITGGGELYIIGKNFLRGTRVFFQLVSEENSDQIIWEKEGDIDKDFFQTTHMIVTVPEYSGTSFVGTKVNCQVVVNSGGKLSDPQPFIYKSVDPITVTIKQDTTEAVEESRKRNYPFVAPEALELNQQIQQTQQVSNSSDMFQLPAGILTGMPKTDRYTPMEQGSGDGNLGRDQSQTTQVNITDKVDSTASVNNNNNSPMNPSTFGTVNLELSPSHAWSSKETNEIFNAFDKSDSNLEMTNINFSSMNAEDYEEPSYMRIKSPRLSNESFHSEHSDQIGTENSSNMRSDDNSIMSKFLQNLSMALKHSDPMFSGAESTISRSVASCSRTALTTVNSRVVMSSDTDNTHVSGNSIGTEKSQPMEHSFLKEALTCPPASLAHPNFSQIHTFTDQGPSSLFSSSKTEPSGMSEMDTNVTQNYRSDREKREQSSEAMELSPETSIMNNNTIDLTSPLHSNPGIPFNNPGTPFSGSIAPSSGHSYPASQVHSPATPYSFGQVQSPATPYSCGQATQVLSPSTPYPSTPYSGSQAQSPCSPYSTETATQISNPSTPFSNGNASSQIHSPATPYYNEVSQTVNTSTEEVLNQSSPYPLADTSSSLPTFSQMSNPGTPFSMNMEGSPSAYSLSQSFSRQSSLELPFPELDHDVLTSLHLNPSLGSEMKSIASLLGHHDSQVQGSGYQPTHTQTRECASHQKTIMSAGIKDRTSVASGEISQHLEHKVNTSINQNPNSASDTSNINAVLKQMLAGISPHQQFTISPEQQQQVVSSQQQQQQVFNQQQQFSQQTQGLGNQSLPTIFSLPGGQVSAVANTDPGQLLAAASASNQSQIPAAPQIIICNNPTSQGQISGQFGAPSIVIVPGQNGQGNQVESLLRSILGTMMQTTQEQQQQPQQQQQQSQQHQSPQ